MKIKIHSISYTHNDERNIERWINRLIEQTLFSYLGLTEGWKMRLSIEDEDQFDERIEDRTCLDKN